MNVLISGDFYVSDQYNHGKVLDKSITDLFDTTDFRIVNLEAPLTANEPKNKILKTGPHLMMSENNVLPYLRQ